MIKMMSNDIVASSHKHVIYVLSLDICGMHYQLLNVSLCILFIFPKIKRRSSSFLSVACDAFMLECHIHGRLVL
jgi:hypothetical protein